MSDAAFRAQPEEGSGLALRGLVTLLMEDDMAGPRSKSGTVHLLDWLTRRIRRVVRSTFSAELNALMDSLENVLLIQLALHEVFCGVTDDVDDLTQRLENGWLYPPVEAMIDAMSVYEALTVEECGTPQESSLKLHLLAVRDRLSRGVIRALHWGDTRDMGADPMTKGGVGRELILAISNEGRYQPEHASKTHQPCKRKFDPVLCSGHIRCPPATL